jgi:hypothetical protein
MVMVTDVVERLKHFGYDIKDDDMAHLEYELRKIQDYVLNYCNIPKIPEILDLRIIDRVCSDFLYYKKNAGLLEGFNYDAVIKQIKEGDTTVSYAVGQGEDTPENRFDAMVKTLERGFDKWLTRFRCIKW